MAISFDDYVSEAFRRYVEENGIDIRRIARECVVPGETYNQCEHAFSRELRGVIEDFQAVIGDYMADDVVMAVSPDYEFDDLVDTDSLFNDSGVARNRKPKSKPKQTSQRVKSSPARKPSKANGSRSTKSECYPSYSEEYPGGPLVDSYGARLVRCNNCMRMFNEYETADGPYGDVCPYCGFDGGLMDMTCSDVKGTSSPCKKRNGASKKPSSSKCVKKKSTGKTAATKPKASTASKSKKRTTAKRRR